MTSIEALLERAVASVRNTTQMQKDILEQLASLRLRLDEDSLRVAVLGQFKRGKSTLLNALLGTPLLPTGITPITAIPTFIRAGPKTSARIRFKDGKEPILVIGDDLRFILERYISEAENSRNRLNVESVELEVRSEFLDQRIVLIDTPGVGSTFAHNTQTAEAVLSECDAAIFVVSADPSITEVEITYLGKVQTLIHKIFFALNKIDLLDSAERDVAGRFLADVLEQQANIRQPIHIFPLSARRGLKAKLNRDSLALAASGIQELERIVHYELAREKHTLLLATARQRAISLVSDLLFQSEFQHKALLLPVEDLEHKAVLFESSIARFEAERQMLSDRLTLDRRRLLTELETETDALWKEAQKATGELVAQLTAQPFEERDVRAQTATLLARYFDAARRQTIALFKKRLDDSLSAHRRRADALVDVVRQAAADLMEIRAVLPQASEAFEIRRDPYWVAPEQPSSLLDISAGALEFMLPKRFREARIKARLESDAKKAVLRNVANLEWAIRQDIDDACRRFGSSLSQQLRGVLEATQDAMQTAIDRKLRRVEKTAEAVEESECSLAELSDVLDQLKSFVVDLS